MKLARSSGVLLHPTSLPGRFGAGDLGPEAYRFADFLEAAGQRLWQVLPLGPTGYGDSPYQSFSTFAGNPLLVSLEKLMEDGDLSAQDLANPPDFPEHTLDFGWVKQYRRPLLERAAENFYARATPARRDRHQAFCRENAAWLDNYALFVALKEVHGGDKVWNQWEPDIAACRPEAVARWRDRLTPQIKVQQYTQYQFFEQWSELKSY